MAWLATVSWVPLMSCTTFKLGEVPSSRFTPLNVALDANWLMLDRIEVIWLPIVVGSMPFCCA